MPKNTRNSKNSKPLPMKIIGISIGLLFILIVVGVMIIPAFFDKNPVGSLFNNQPAPWALSPKELAKFNYSESEQSGRGYFIEYCASCHGPTGKGNGPLSVNLRKRIPNFLSPSAKYINGFEKDLLFKTINEGIPNSEMPKFNYIPQLAKENIVEYLLHLKKYQNMY